MTSKLSFKQSLIAGLTAGIVAALINTILFFIFHSVKVLDDSIYPKPNEPLTVVPVIMASIIPSIIGAVIFFILEKYTNKGFRIFSIITISLTLLSLYSPFSVIPNVTTGYAIVLDVMHLIVAGTLLFFLNKKLK